MNLNEEFWDSKYKSNNIGWDIGEISTPLKTYIDQLTNKELKILIPGGGNSYEAEYLYQKGFKNIYVIDISQTALTNLKKRVPTFPSSHLIKKDFFDLKLTFDLILEQTFFCALSPTLRPKYVKKASQLLKNDGKLVGLLFNIPLFEDHPPFGGNRNEYLNYFTSNFTIEIMEKCYNSSQGRTDNELFIKLLKI